MDTEKVRRDMKMSNEITNRDSLGEYINKECKEFDVYKLEQIPDGSKYYK